MLDVESFERKVLAVFQELDVSRRNGNDFGVAELVFGHAFEHGFGTDPVAGSVANVFGHVVDAFAFDAHHLAQAVVTHQATGMVAVRMRQEHVIDGGCRKRTFTHVDAEVQFGELDVGRKSRNRKAGDGRARSLQVNLL